MGPATSTSTRQCRRRRRRRQQLPWRSPVAAAVGVDQLRLPAVTDFSTKAERLVGVTSSRMCRISSTSTRCIRVRCRQASISTSLVVQLLRNWPTTLLLQRLRHRPTTMLLQRLRHRPTTMLLQRLRHRPTTLLLQRALEIATTLAFRWHQHPIGHQRLFLCLVEEAQRWYQRLAPVF